MTIRQAEDEFQEMFDRLGDFDEVRALTQSKVADDVGRSATGIERSAAKTTPEMMRSRNGRAFLAVMGRAPARFIEP